MTPLAKLWTWTGHLFIPLAIGWAVFVRSGLADEPPSDGVIFSRAYWGVLVTLIAGSVLAWSWALYVKVGRHQPGVHMVPPNTTFEEAESRSLVISWVTAATFALSVVLALTIFGVRYGESVVHGWNAPTPADKGFVQSRLKAHDLGCQRQPCFAVGRRIKTNNQPIFGVNEYVLYVTDGAILVLSLTFGAGLMSVALEATRLHPAGKKQGSARKKGRERQR